jgi:hypothetical protein
VSQSGCIEPSQCFDAGGMVNRPERVTSGVVTEAGWVDLSLITTREDERLVLLLILIAVSLLDYYSSPGHQGTIGVMPLYSATPNTFTTPLSKEATDPVRTPAARRKIQPKPFWPSEYDATSTPLHPSIPSQPSQAWLGPADTKPAGRFLVVL